ncbi:MAG: hypothetical protein AAFV43_10290 [Planctomycetota bacterium]
MPRYRLGLVVGKIALATALMSAPAWALGPTSFGIDALSYAPQFDSGFAFGQVSATPNGFDSITVQASAAPGGSSFGAVGMNFNTIGGASGLNFDPADYQIEMVYKLNPSNTAQFLTVQLAQSDGGGLNDSFNWGIGDIVGIFNDGTPDADGFVTLTRDLTELPNPFTGSETEPWDFVTGTGDKLLDTDTFENGAANTVTQLQLQMTDGSNVLDMDLKSIRIAEKAPTAAGRLDSGGWNRAYGVMEAPGALTRDNGVDDFTNLVIDATGFGGVLQRGLPSADVFDGSSHSIEITARTLPGNTATNFGVILGDLDGNDDTANEGADSYYYLLNTEDFGSSDLTTLTIPIDAVTPSGPVFTFFNGGDGLSTDFNLIELQLQSIDDGTRLNLEVEGIRIVETPVMALPDGDFNADGRVDNADLNLLLDNWGESSVPAEWVRQFAGAVDNEELNFLLNTWGAGTSVAVPEPTALVIGLCSLAVLRGRRR